MYMSVISGPHNFRGMSMSEQEFEFLLGKAGAVETEIKKDPRQQVKDPRQQVKDVMFNSLGKNGNRDSDSDDNNDW